MKKFLAVALMVAMVGAVSLAGELRSLPVDMQGRYGATHYVEIGPALFDGMATNISYTDTFGVPAGTTVRFVAYECATPFTGAEATNKVFGNATVAFGTENSPTAFMPAKQCGTNTTVWWFSGVPAVSVSTTTNFVSTATAAAETTYSAATNLMVTVAPGNGLDSLDWATHGKLRIFVQKREPYGK
jgi:hypothetical protein